MAWPHLALLISIRELGLSDNNIGTEGAKSLGPHLSHLTSIQTLFLEGNNIGGEGDGSLRRHMALALRTSLKMFV